MTMATVPASQVDGQLTIALEKIEELIPVMQNETSGIQLQIVKTFRTTLTNVCPGSEIVSWLMKHFSLPDREEAAYLAKTMALYGYIHTVPDCKLTVKDDGTFHRFQNPYFWPTAVNEVTTYNYAVYLCKRMMSNKSRLQLDEHELETFTKLQNHLHRKWELIYMEADAKYKVEKKKEKMQKRINETQERAFWNLHRPAPSFNNVLEADIKKVRMDESGFGPRHGAARVSLQLAAKLSEDALNHALDDAMRKTDGRYNYLTEATTTTSIHFNEVDDIRQLLHRQTIKSSTAAEGLIQKTTQYAVYDPFVTPPTPSNPWISEDTSFWQDNTKKYTSGWINWIEMDNKNKTGSFIAGSSDSLPQSTERIVPPQKQVRRWGFSLNDLLRDSQGTVLFLKYLEKEFSAENLRFWLTVEEFKFCPLSIISGNAKQIHKEYIGKDAMYSINVDSRAVELVNERMKDPNHFTFDPAQEQIYTLMRTDSYKRFLKSDQYESLLRDTPQSRRGIVDAIKGWRGPKT